MVIGWLLLVVFGAGAIGGVANAIMTDNGFILPRPEETGGPTVWRPGFLGNAFISGVAATISWGLYGSAANWLLIGEPTASQGRPSLALSAFVGAILVGVGGARWLTSEVDKKLLRAAASNAATKPADPSLAIRMAQATPAQALKLSRG